MFRARRWRRLRQRRAVAAEAWMRAPAIASALTEQPTRRTWRVRVELPVAGLFVYWFVNGEFVQRTAGPELLLGCGSAPRTVEALASRHGDLRTERWRRPPVAARHTLEWIRPDEDVDEYRVEIATGESGDTWAEFARVRDTGAWSYRVQTPELEDLSWYRFRVRAIYAGNPGTAIEWPARYVVRIPDNPTFAAEWDSELTQVTFVEA